MNWRDFLHKDFIRSVVREEMTKTIGPATSAPLTVPDLPERTTIFARLNDLRTRQSSIEARKADTLVDEERIAQLEVELAEIHHRVRIHKSDLWAEWLDNSVAIDRQLALLMVTCSPQLEQFLDLMKAELARLLCLKPNTQHSFGEANIMVDTPRKPLHIFSDLPSITRRITAVRAAISRAEELKTLERSDEELRLELDGLEAALPSIDNVLELVERV